MKGKLIVAITLGTILLVGMPVESLEISMDTGLPDYIMDGELNLTGTYKTTFGSFLDDTDTEFDQGTLRNLTTNLGALRLEPTLDVTMLNNGNPVLKAGTGTDWDLHVWSLGVTKVNGKYYLYYTGGKNTGLDTDKDIGLAISSDGVNFAKHSLNPVLTNGAHTCVNNPVPFFNGSWNLYYTANDGALGANRDMDGMYAYSNDPVNWTRYAQNPIIPNGNPNNQWDGLQVMTECILDEGDSYKLYYTGDNGPNMDWQAGLATSKDGVNWNKHANNPVYSGAGAGWDKGHVKINSIEKANGSYRAFITGDFSSPKVGWAWSTNGVNWQDSGSALISKKAGTIYSISIGNARAVFEGDHYKLYTLCYDGSRSIGCFKLVPKGLDGRYTSRMLDAGGPVRLINVTWNEGFSVVGNMTFQLRYGNSTSAMTAWTDLSAGTELANVTARYYQYRVDLDVPRDWMRASIQWVNISYEVPVDKIEAIIDGSAPIPVDFNFTSWWLNVSLDDGNHTVIIRITDATGSTVDIRLDPRVDLYPPRGYVLIEEGRWAHNSTRIMVEIGATDTNPPIDMQLSLVPDFTSVTWGPWVPEFGWQLTTISDGNLTVYARLRDDAGRVSETYNDSILIDTTPPEGSLVINGGDKYTNSTVVDLSLDWTDLTGVTSMMVSNDPGFEDATWQDPLGQMLWTLDGTEGVQTVHVRLRDAVGWVTTISDGIILDRTPPSASISIDADSPFCTDRDVVLTISIYDDNPIDYKLVNAGEPWPDAWRSTTIPIDVPWTLGVGADGERTVRMLVRDAAGNEFIASDYIVLDTKPPEGTLTLNGGDDFTNTMVTSAILEASDATSGLVRMRISDSDDFTDVAWQGVKDAFTWPLPPGDGPKTVYVQLRDAAGLTVTLDDTIILDTEAPTGSFLIEGGAEFVTSTTVSLAMGFDDMFGLMGMRVSNEPTFGDAVWLPYATGLPWELLDQEGERIVYVQVRDMAGNVVFVSSSVVLDLSDPVVTLMINDGDEATLELDVLLTWSASDTSGLAAYAISSTKDLGGADWISLSGETSVEEEIQEHTINGPDGLKLVYLGVRDTAGRISTTSDSIWYVTSRPEGTVLLGDGSGWTNTSTIEVRAEHTGGSVATHYKAAFSPSGLEAAGWVPIVTMVMLEPTEPGGVVTVYCLLLGPHNVTSDLLIDSIRQDLLAPNIEIVSPSVDRTENENIKLILSVVDDMDTAPSLDWRINGGDWTPYEVEVPVGLKEGRNLIEVRSEDAAGNVGTADWTIESERDFYFGGSSLIILIVIILVVSVVAALYWMRHSRPGRPPE